MRTHLWGRKPGTPKTGGRKPGSLNRKSQERQAILEVAIAEVLAPEQVGELSPLQVMRSVMRHHYLRGDYDKALVAATACAPFCHPRLAMSEVTVRHGLAEHSDEDLAAELAALRLKRTEAARTIEHEPALRPATAQALTAWPGGPEASRS
jgi:hypothetical protein